MELRLKTFCFFWLCRKLGYAFGLRAAHQPFSRLHYTRRPFVFGVLKIIDFHDITPPKSLTKTTPPTTPWLLEPQRLARCKKAFAFCTENALHFLVPVTYFSTEPLFSNWDGHSILKGILLASQDYEPDEKDAQGGSKRDKIDGHSHE